MSESAVSRGLSARDIVVGYGKNDPILEGLSLDVLPGELTVIVGPNACGKSTLLRSLARVLGVRRGVVELGGRSVTDMNQKALARRLGLLAQSSVTPSLWRRCAKRRTSNWWLRSRYVVGSSRSRISVAWASDIAIHTR